MSHTEAIPGARAVVDDTDLSTKVQGKASGTMALTGTSKGTAKAAVAGKASGAILLAGTAAAEAHKPAGDRVHVGMRIRPIRRVHCGGRRRPGGRRTSSRSAGGGSSGDSDSAEPAGEHHRRRADDDHVVLRHRLEVGI